MIMAFEITVIILLIIVIICCFYNRALASENEEMQQTLKYLSNQIDQIKSKQKVFEQRFMKLSDPSDKVQIIHKYDDSDAPNFGSF